MRICEFCSLPRQLYSSFANSWKTADSAPDFILETLSLKVLFIRLYFWALAYCLDSLLVF